jgi:signal-transduction protein with cAMP-binding, CBS, and nucleotidyltransferase domain
MGMGDTVRAILDQKGGWICWVNFETSVYEALELMAGHDIGAVMVYSEGQLCGVFSERDYARKVILLGKASKDTTVGEIMSSPAITVDPNRKIEECMQLMMRQHIRHLPVVESDVVLGMISIGDLVNWTIQRQGEEIEHLNHYIAGVYPA